MNKDSLFCIRGKSFDSGGGWYRGGGPAYPRFVGAASHAPGVCAGLVAPAATDARGAAPREQAVRLGSSLPEVGAGGPHTPMRGRSAPPPRVTFPSRGKSPKARQGLRPWTCRCKVSALAALAAHRAGLPSATEKDRFATLRWWANRPLLFPLALTRKNILLLIRGAGAPRGRCGCTFGCNFWGDSGYR